MMTEDHELYELAENINGMCKECGEVYAEYDIEFGMRLCAACLEEKIK